MASMPICSVPECDKVSRTRVRELCYQHDYRQRRYGDVHGGQLFAGTHLKFARQAALHSDGDCLFWPFGRNRDGSGQIKLNGRTTRASRYICELVNGPAPIPQHETAHSCGQGHLGCVSGAHLRWATHQENIDDRTAHGTTARGSRSGRSKLTESEVIQIVEIRRRTGQSHKAIAAQFNVSAAAISLIFMGHNWTWLTGIPYRRKSKPS